MKEMVVYKGKTRVWVGSIIAAFIASFAVFLGMLQMEKEILSAYEKGAVIVAKKEIPKGVCVEENEFDDYFEIKELDQKLLTPFNLSERKDVRGMAARYSVEKGTILTKGMFENLSDVLENMENPVIAGFKVDDLYQVVGGVLRAGDRVHLYRVCEQEENLNAGVETEKQEEKFVTTLVWENVYIQDVFEQSGVRIACDDKITSAQRINVYLDQRDIEKFYTELAQGSLRAVKVCK